MARNQTRYKNNGGQHALPGGKVVATGETFDATDPDLAKKFPNKFTVVGVVESPDAEPLGEPLKAAPAPVAPPAAPAPVEVTEPPEGTGGADNGKADGTDVTADFPEAKKNELTVTKDAAGYWVRDDGDATNTSALRSKTAVNKEIARYIKG